MINLSLRNLCVDSVPVWTNIYFDVYNYILFVKKNLILTYVQQSLAGRRALIPIFMVANLPKH